MNSDEIYDLLEEIKAAKGNEKIKLIEANKDDDLFKKVLILAYDPSITFGIKKTVKASAGSNTFTVDTFNLLSELSDRKLTGANASMAIKTVLAFLSLKSGELLIRILKKNLKCGINVSSINKAIPGLIATFTCMLAQKFEESRIKQWPVAVEEKFDGVRTLAVCKCSPSGWRVTLHSRTGKLFSNAPHIEAELLRLLETHSWFESIVLDGELIHEDGFNEIVGAVHRKGTNADGAVYMVFDHIPLIEFTGYKRTGYADRRKKLDYFLRGADSQFVKPTVRYLVNNPSEIFAIYKNVRDRNGEGVIVKSPIDGLYENKRSHNWMKIKDKNTVDLPIVDIQEGTGKFENSTGALICDFNGVTVNVGSGLDDETRDAVWRDANRYIGTIAEVEYHEVTPEKSLRHPRFVRFRSDKTIEEGVGV